MQITLSREQINHATLVGVERHMEAIKRGYKDQHGMNPINGLAYHVNGACGELAAAIALGESWDAAVNVYKVPDVGDLYVRTAAKDEGELIIRPSDKDGIYLLVTGIVPTFVVRGAASKEKAWPVKAFRKSPGGRPEACFVPQNRLVPFEQLKEKLNA